MPLLKFRGFFAPVSWAITVALVTQILAPVLAQGTRKPTDPPSNPILDAQKKKETALPLPRDQQLPDFRGKNDPAAQRLPKTPTGDLPLFGYNHFQPARQAILLYRTRFERLLSNNTPTSRRQAATSQITQQEVDESVKLTDSQKLDLLLRQREGKLTPDEKRRYRVLLYPNAVRSGAPVTPSVTDESGSLTDTQKIELLVRQREGKLTQDERLRYRSFLDLDAYGNDANTSTDDQGSGGNSTGPDKPKTGQDKNTPDKTGRDKTTNDVRDVKRDSSNTDTGEIDTLQTGRSRSTGPGTLNSRRRSDQSDSSDTDLPSVDAYHQVAGPLEQLYQNISASVPTNYQLSAGDRITLRLSSPTMEMRESTLLVDPTGSITLPGAGRVVVRGKTLEQAETDLAARLQRYYRNAQVSLTLKELRTMPITISGESFSPGTYVVPAIASAFNMIYATGGPTEDGSLRQIEIRRRGKLVGTIDFYKFLLTADQTGDIPLEPGDVIYIPGKHSRVAVSGEVRRPAVFELVQGESLKDALGYAGGIKPSGVDQRVQISTVQPGAAHILKDVDVRNLQTAAATPVYDGDTVEVFSLRTTLTNVVTVEGAVDQPGQYAMSANMTVADLLERSRGLLADAYPNLGHLYRWNPDSTLTLVPINLEKALARDPSANLPLSRWDRLTVYTRQEIAWTGRREVTVRGAVKNAGIYYRSDNMHVRDLLLQAGGTLPEAYTERAYLLHRRPDETYEYQFVNLASALHEDPASNVLVQDNDILAVYRTDEARFTPEHIVSIQGEVVSPGKYPRGEKMLLSDALKVAGGLTPKAGERILIAHSRVAEGRAPTVVTYTPSSASASPDPVLEDGDVVTIQGRGDYQAAPYIVNIEGAVNRPGPVILSGPKVRLSEVIKEAGGLKPEAFPLGVEFARNPAKLTNTGQKQTALMLTKLNDILNQDEYKRALARSDIERIKAVGAAARSGSGLSIPGITPSIDSVIPNPALASGTQSLFSRDLVSSPRKLTPEDLQPNGNVAVDLKAALAHPGGEDDILMADGDTVTVPTTPTTVEVIGAVMQSRGVLYHEGAKLEYYLDHVGGYSPDASRDRVLVIHLGGGLVPIKKVKEFLPGDVIIVPTKVLEAQIGRRQNDLDTIFRNLTSSVLVVLVAKKLLGL